MNFQEMFIAFFASQPSVTPAQLPQQNEDFATFLTRNGLAADFKSFVEEKLKNQYKGSDQKGYTTFDFDLDAMTGEEIFVSQLPATRGLVVPREHKESKPAASGRGFVHSFWTTIANTTVIVNFSTDTAEIPDVIGKPFTCMLKLLQGNGKTFVQQKKAYKFTHGRLILADGLPQITSAEALATEKRAQDLGLMV